MIWRSEVQILPPHPITKRIRRLTVRTDELIRWWEQIRLKRASCTNSIPESVQLPLEWGRVNDAMVWSNGKDAPPHKREMLVQIQQPLIVCKTWRHHNITLKILIIEKARSGRMVKAAQVVIARLWVPCSYRWKSYTRITQWRFFTGQTG